MKPAELKSLRQSLGLSAEAFARLVGATDGAHIRKMERDAGAPPRPMRIIVEALRDSRAVRQHFGVAVEGDETQKEPPPPPKG